MLEHVIMARMEWESKSEQIMVAVDLQKAYDSVSFRFLRVSQEYIGLPMSYVSLCCP